MQRRRSGCRVTLGRGLLLLTAFLGQASSSATDAFPRPQRLIYNSDGVNIFIDHPPPMEPDDVYRYVDEVAETQVTTFFMCPNFCMKMLYPSEVTEMIGTTLDERRWEEIERLARQTDGARHTTERAMVNLRELVAAGHDPVGLVVDQAQAKGLETFLTFRLNEIHDVQNPESLLVSQFWRANPQWRVGRIGDPIQPPFKEIIGGRPDHQVHPIVASWFPGALDFSVPEVRALRLRELRECCTRYPIDGLDLDFQRFPIYFPQDEGREHIETMTAWVREVRLMCREVGEERGRPLLLSARILARPEQNLAIGLDPFQWAREDLVDFVVVSHYLRNDFALPIAEFRSRLPADLPIYGSIEVERDVDAYRRIGRRLYNDGVDGILLFNFFTTREGGTEPPFSLLHELGDPATIQSIAEEKNSGS